MGKLSDTIDTRLKELGIPGSKMCDDLGMSRSTLTELRKGRATTLKAEKAAKIAAYLGLTVEELLGAQKAPVQDVFAGWYPPERFWNKINSDRSSFLHYLLEVWDAPPEDIETVWNVPIVNPDTASETVFRQFVQGVVKAVRFDPEDGSWDIITNSQEEKAHASKGERKVSDDDIMFALWGDTSEVSQADLEDVKRYAAFIRERKNKHD